MNKPLMENRLGLAICATTAAGMLVLIGWLLRWVLS